ncbi:LysR family transcriptional regulator [Photobacterium profundum]|uniref:LysR family transcriptional regulator n=1 Tax=Photobacterium profundum TaxID=74109 RepID=UPI003D09DBD6
MIDFNKFQYLCTVADTGNLSVAAERLDTSKSSLSRNLDQLEKTFDCQLLVRDRNGVVLTDAGEKVYSSVKMLVERLNDSCSSLIEDAKKQLITLKIGLSDYIYHYYIPAQFIRSFSEKYPNVNVEIFINNGFSQAELVTLDIQFKISNKMMKNKIFNVNKSLYVSNKYAEQFGTPEKPTDLCHHKILHLNTGWGEDLWEMYDGDDWCKINFSKSLVSNSLKVIKDSMLLGSGIAAIPERVPLPEQGVNQVLEDYPMRVNHFGFELVKNKTKYFYQRLFISSLLEFYRENDYPPLLLNIDDMNSDF